MEDVSLARLADRTVFEDRLAEVCAEMERERAGFAAVEAGLLESLEAERAAREQAEGAYAGLVQEVSGLRRHELEAEVRRLSAQALVHTEELERLYRVDDGQRIAIHRLRDEASAAREASGRYRDRAEAAEAELRELQRINLSSELGQRFVRELAAEKDARLNAEEQVRELTMNLSLARSEHASYVEETQSRIARIAETESELALVRDSLRAAEAVHADLVTRHATLEESSLEAARVFRAKQGAHEAEMAGMVADHDASRSALREGAVAAASAGAEALRQASRRVADAETRLSGLTAMVARTLHLFTLRKDAHRDSLTRAHREAERADQQREREHQAAERQAQALRDSIDAARKDNSALESRLATLSEERRDAEHRHQAALGQLRLELERSEARAAANEEKAKRSEAREASVKADLEKITRLPDKELRDVMDAQKWRTRCLELEEEIARLRRR
jgi:hypothetical protein